MSAPPNHSEILMPKTVQLETFELVDRISVPDSCITGMAVTEDNKLLACNRSLGGKNLVIFVFDQNNKFSETIQMAEPGPWEITIIPNNSHTAVVTFGSSNKIQFLDTKSLQPGTVVTLNGSAIGIASTKENIFVGSDRKILVLTVDGALQRTISLSTHGRIFYIHADSMGTIFYSDYTQITCITTDGKLVYSYTIEGETQNRSIATDHNGNVYAVGRNTNQIVRLTPNGSIDRVVLYQDNEIYTPVALCFNNSCEKLYVSNYGSKEILIFKCK